VNSFLTAPSRNILTYLLFLLTSLAVLVVVFVVVVGPPLRKAKGSVVSNRIRVKFGRIVLQINTHRLTRPSSSAFITMTFTATFIGSACTVTVAIFRTSFFLLSG